MKKFLKKAIGKTWLGGRTRYELEADGTHSIKHFDWRGRLSDKNGVPALLKFTFNKAQLEIVEISRYREGKLHSPGDIPARQIFFQKGLPSEVSYFNNGRLHRELDKPALTIWSPKNFKEEEACYQRGELHSSHGVPTRVVRFDKDRIREFSYYREGKLHREDDEPAQILWSSDNYVRCNRWAENGQLHRAAGPAVIERKSPFYKSRESFFAEGRKIGPTHVRKDGAWWWQDEEGQDLTMNEAEGYLELFEREPEGLPAWFLKSRFLKAIEHRTQEQELEERIEEIGELIEGLNSATKLIGVYDRFETDQGQIVEECRDTEGELHSEDGAPARIVWDREGFVLSEEWFCRGLPHRDDGDPAVVSSLEGKRLHKEWWEFGVRTF